MTDTNAPKSIDLVESVRSVLAKGMTQAKIAREIGISGTTLSQWLGDTYQGSVGNVETKVATWLKSLEVAGIGAAPKVASWVDTPSGRAIETALRFAQHEGSISVVYGGAGLGKSTAIRHYAENHPNVWTLTASPSSAGLMATLESVAAAVGLSDLPNRPSAFAREIVRRISGTRGLLVVDEAQHISVQALEELRSIHDASQVGLVLSGNEAVYARLTGGSRRATFAQLFSRVGHRHRVTPPTTADTDAILGAWGIHGSDERRWSQQVASLPGGLRGLVQTLRQAALAASGAEVAIDLRLMQAAWHKLGGES